MIHLSDITYGQKHFTSVKILLVELFKYQKKVCPSLQYVGYKPSQDEITCFRISGTWRKHATPCFRYVYVEVVRFRCIRSNGNARKSHETGNGNTGYPSCFRNGLTCFCHVSVYGFLQFRPVHRQKRCLSLQ